MYHLVLGDILSDKTLSIFVVEVPTTEICMASGWFRDCPIYNAINITKLMNLVELLMPSQPVVVV